MDGKEGLLVAKEEEIIYLIIGEKILLQSLAIGINNFILVRRIKNI